MPKPARNVVYIHSHDTGRYIAPYGHALPTPSYQRFAEQGVLFRHAFCANPTCSPSRASLLTGQYAHTNGMLGLAHRGGKLNQPEHLLPHFLREQGFRTAIAGLQHITDDASMGDLGYTDDLPQTDDFETKHAHERDERAAHRAARFLEDRDADAPPFFLDVGFFTTHRTGWPDDRQDPHGHPTDWHNGDASPLGDPRYAPVPPCLPDTPEVRRDFADYTEAVRRLDDYVGRVLDAIDRTGRADDTLVILTTDHGIAFPRMKCRLTAHGAGVLLLMRGPSATHDDGFRGGRVINGLASHVDVFPTVCDSLGIDAPDWPQGTSLAPLIKQSDDTGAVREHVFTEVNYHAAREPMRGVRNHRFSYVRNLEPLGHTTRPNIDDSVTKTQLHNAGLFDREVPDEQLFDLYADPQEACNVVADPSYAEALAAMRVALDAWMQETDDPALDGPVRVPGMTMNAADAYSPGKSPTTKEA
ncbi:MAG: sulfatase [Planctomycetota bacterium]